ncbi:MAG: response regulator, partial [Desulfobacterales bacterium]|nr:response regulator [Desulfobacterales bacterium]
MRILIAEDDPVTRRLLEASLRKWGYDVLVTVNGSEAWQALQEPEAPSLVISDWMMPVMDGLELCRKIRKMEKSGY